MAVLDWWHKLRMDPGQADTKVNRVRFVAAALALVVAALWITFVLTRGWVRPAAAVIPIYFGLLVAGVALTWWLRDRALWRGSRASTTPNGAA